MQRQQRRARRAPEGTDDEPFVALDFETANPDRTSACALALVRVEGGRVVASERTLIRPPTLDFTFTWLHGIDADAVRAAPDFAQAWTRLAPLLPGARFLAAHNAPFDRSVLLACCAHHGLAPPTLPFVCTVALARRAFGIYPTALPDVCRELRIPLDHHEPLSDATACARIVIAATRHTGRR